MTHHPSVAALVALLLMGAATLSAARENDTQLLASINNIGECVIPSTFSFLYKDSFPPTTSAGFRELCRNQAEGIKCIRDRIKQTPALIKRGMASFAQSRQRHHRKYCSNVDSELSKRFISDVKCIMDKKFATYQRSDSDFAHTVEQIKRRNFNDSALELKYICCTILALKKRIVDNVAPECVASRATMEEFANAVVTSDIELICEDEENLLKNTCPKLEPLPIPKGIFQLKSDNSPTAILLYLVATLGESHQERQRK